MIGNYITERRQKVAIASGMRDLAQNIASSHEDRAKALQEVKAETKRVREEAEKLLKSFHASRKELKAELKEASAAWQGLTAAKAKTN